jgi:hypothetical protein
MTENNQILSEISFTRPVLLSFMCILSFIINGFMILLGIVGLFSIGYFSSLLETYASGKGALSSEIILWLSICILLISGIKLWGVLLMHIGRKAGYLLYLFPTVILMIASIYLIYTLHSISLIVYLFISILFVFTYGTFYKLMR